jgi:hypothetical protein
VRAGYFSAGGFQGPGRRSGTAGYAAGPEAVGLAAGGNEKQEWHAFQTLRREVNYSVDGVGGIGGISVVAVNAEPVAVFSDEDAGGLAAAGDMLAIDVGRFRPIVGDPGDIATDGDFRLMHLGMEIFRVLEVVGVTAHFVVLAGIEIGVFFTEGSEIGMEKGGVAVNVGMFQEGISRGIERRAERQGARTGTSSGKA